MKYSKLSAIPQVKIKDVKEGPVWVYGELIPLKLLTAPVSNTQCIHYAYNIQQYKNDTNRKGRRWVPLTGGHKWTQFLIEDDTGQIFVQPKKAKIEGWEYFEYIKDYNDLSDAFKNKYMSNVPKHYNNYHLKIREKMIEPEGEISVFGKAVKDEKGKLQIRSAGYPELTIFNDPPKTILSNAKQRLKLSIWLTVISMSIGLILMVIGLF